MFKAKDEGETGTVATKDIIRDAIMEAFPELEPQQIQALDSLAEQREGGRWAFESITKWGFRTLQEIVDQNIMMHSLNTTVVKA